MSDEVGSAAGRTVAPRILVADDDALIRLVVRRTLEREGYEVVDAQDVSSAVEAARTGIALAVLDAHMPGGTLAATIAGVREAAGHDTPILVLSGDRIAPPEVSGPAMAFLAKPASVSELLEAVDTLLRLPRTRD